jgi:membrane protease YdiL (CAAX protease family)
MYHESMSRPDRAPPLSEAALLVVVVFGLALAAAVIGGPSARVPVVQLLAVGVPAVVYAIVHPASGIALLGLTRPRTTAVVGAIVAGGGVLLVNLAAIVGLGFAIFGEPATAPRSLEGALVIQLLGIALVPAVCEELVFRGVLLRSLVRHGAWLAVLASSAVFAVFHFSSYRLLPTFAVGVVCGLAVLWSRSTWTGIVAHLTNNATLLILASAGADLGVLPAVAWTAIGILLVGSGLWLTWRKGVQ